MANVELEKLCDWIIENRRGKAFKDYSRESIIRELQESNAARGLLVDSDAQGNILGVLVCSPRLHVNHALTTQKGVFSRLARYVLLLFPSMEVQAFRGDKLVVYKNPKRGFRLLSNQDTNNRFFFRKEMA
jgi:hypothetical protein